MDEPRSLRKELNHDRWSIITLKPKKQKQTCQDIVKGILNVGRVERGRFDERQNVSLYKNKEQW